jgi:hypothetical protein
MRRARPFGVPAGWVIREYAAASVNAKSSTAWAFAIRRGRNEAALFAVDDEHG